MSNFDHLISSASEAVIIPLSNEYTFAYLELCQRSTQDINDKPIDYAENIGEVEKILQQSQELGQDRFLVLSKGIVAGSIEMTDVIPTFHSTKEISVYIDRDYRGIGIGSSVIDSLSEHYLEKPEVEEIVAFTRETNFVCIKALEKAHFSIASEVAGSYLKFSRY